MFEENYQQKFDYLESEIAHLRSSVKVPIEEKKKWKVSSIQRLRHMHMVNRIMYNDNIRQCCFELFSMTAGIHQVYPIITCVIKNLTEKEIDVLPSVRTLVRMST